MPSTVDKCQKCDLHVSSSFYLHTWWTITIFMLKTRLHLQEKMFQLTKCKDWKWIAHSIYSQKTCGLICFRTIDFGESAFLSTFDQTKANEWTINWLYLEGPTALLFCFTTLRVVQGSQNCPFIKILRKFLAETEVGPTFLPCQFHMDL